MKELKETGFETMSDEIERFVNAEALRSRPGAMLVGLTACFVPMLGSIIAQTVVAGREQGAAEGVGAHFRDTLAEYVREAVRRRAASEKEAAS